LSFTAKDTDVKKLLKDFHPNRTPEEELRAGSFGITRLKMSSIALARRNGSKGYR
jgi:hypothetical protein